MTVLFSLILQLYAPIDGQSSFCAKRLACEYFFSKFRPMVCILTKGLNCREVGGHSPFSQRTGNFLPNEMAQEHDGPGAVYMQREGGEVRFKIESQGPPMHREV